MQNPKLIHKTQLNNIHMQAMLFAAGLGTRLRPLTDHTPKALVRVGGQPLIDIVINRLKHNGCHHIVINVHHFAQQVIDHVADNDWGIRVEISDESQQLLDTGGGLKKALPLFAPESPVLIHNVDIISNADLQTFYADNTAHAATLLVSERQTQRYLLFDQHMKLVGWTNISTGEVRTPYPELDVTKCHKLAFSGIHLIRPDIVAPLMEQWPDKFPIMDFYLQNCHRIEIKGVMANNLKLLDVGKQQTLEAAERFIKELN